MKNSVFTFWLALLLVSGSTGLHADVKIQPRVLQATPPVHTGSVRPPIKPSDIQNAPIPDDDSPAAGETPKSGTGGGTTGTGGSATSSTGTGTVGVISAVHDSKKLSQEAMIGLIVLSLLSLGSLWASVRIIVREWDQQPAAGAARG